MSGKDAVLDRYGHPILKVRGDDSIAVAAAEVTLDGKPLHATRIVIDLDVDRGWTMATITLPVILDVDAPVLLQCDSVCPIGMRYRCEQPAGHVGRHTGPEGYDWADLGSGLADVALGADRCKSRRPWYGGEEYLRVDCVLERGHEGNHGATMHGHTETWDA